MKRGLKGFAFLVSGLVPVSYTHLEGAGAADEALAGVH